MDGFQDEEPSTNEKLCSEHRYKNILMSNNNLQGLSTGNLEEMRFYVYNFEKEVQKLFGARSEGGLNTLKFHLRDHLIDDVNRFGTVLVLSASPYEHFNLIVEQAYATA